MAKPTIPTDMVRLLRWLPEGSIAMGWPGQLGVKVDTGCLIEGQGVDPRSRRFTHRDDLVRILDRQAAPQDAPADGVKRRGQTETEG